MALKPWEFEKLTPREFELMVKGYKSRLVDADARTAYFVALNTNVHIPKANQRIKVKDLIRGLHPPTALDRAKEEIEFMKEWEQEANSSQEEGEI